MMWFVYSPGRSVLFLITVNAAVLTVWCHANSGTDQTKRSGNGLSGSLQNIVSSQNESPGSSFIRWGRSICPSGTTLLYSGYAAGSNYNHPGGGANRLCVGKHPVYDETPLELGYGQLYGAEYSIPGHHNTDVLCAVCLASQQVTFMMPGTNRLVTQYKGYLTSGYYNNPAPSEFLCLDEQPEERPESDAIGNGAFFEHVRTHCGSLPCPPYTESKVATCAVCSL